MEPVKNQVRQRLVHGHIRTHQADIPVAAAPFHQGHHLPGSVQARLIGGLRLAGAQLPFCCSNGKRSLEQLLPDNRQGGGIGLHQFHLNFNASSGRAAVQLLGGLPRFFKGQQRRSNLVAVDTDRNTGRGLNQMLQNGQVLPGKIRKSVYVKHMLLGKAPLLQVFQQPGHLVSGVPLALAAQAVIAFHQQRQLLQLLGQAAFRFLRRLAQVLGADAAALELVHTVDQTGQKFRLGLHGGVGLQTAAELSGRRGHGHYPTAAVQAFLRRAAHGIRHPAGQAGKGQHLRVTAGGVPRRGAQAALHFMADQFRDHQDPVSLPFVHIPGDAAQNLFPVGRPVPAQQQMQHGSASFFLFSTSYHIFPGKNRERSALEEDIFQTPHGVQQVEADFIPLLAFQRRA